MGCPPTFPITSAGGWIGSEASETPPALKRNAIITGNGLNSVTTPFLALKIFFSHFYWRGRFTETDLPSNSALPKWLQRLDLSQDQDHLPGLMRVQGRSQGLEPFATAFPGYKPGAGGKWSSWNVNQCPRGMPAHARLRALAARLTHQALT